MDQLGHKINQLEIISHAVRAHAAQHRSLGFDTMPIHPILEWMDKLDLVTFELDTYRNDLITSRVE